MEQECKSEHGVKLSNEVAPFGSICLDGFGVSFFCL